MVRESLHILTACRAIRISWLAFTFPCLLVAYIGQAAYISVHPEAVSNPFFNAVPPHMFWPSLVLSIAAAIVASQAMITGSFQLISQAMQMSYFPNIKLVHTSRTFHGQIYVPMVNWLMMIGTVLVTVVYNNTASLGRAYGVCVVCVTFITTCLVSVCAMIVWQLHPLVVVAGFVVFGALDMVFLSSALTKVPSGAWFTLLLAGAISSLLLVWRYGKNNQWAAEGHDLVTPARLVMAGGAGGGELRLRGTAKRLRMLKGLGVFFDKAGFLAPAVYTHFVRKFEAQHDVAVFFTLRPIAGPHIPAAERYAVTRIAGVPNTFRVIVRHGYADFVFSDDDFGAVLAQHIRAFLDAEIKLYSASSASAAPREGGGGQDHPKLLRAQQELDMLAAAVRKQVVYILGKEQLHLRRDTNILRRVLLSAFIWMRENTRSKPAELNVPFDQLVEVGFIKEI